MTTPSPGNEGPRCHTGSGEARLRTGPPPGRQPPLRGSGRRTYPDGHRARCTRRGHAKGDARCHQAPVGATSRGSSLRMYRSLGVKRKLPCLSCALPEAGHPRHDGQPDSYVPGGPSGKELPPLLDGQAADPFQVHLDTVDKRRLHFIEGGPERCDIEVNADRLPTVTVAMDMAAKSKGGSRKSAVPEGTVRHHVHSISLTRVKCQAQARVENGCCDAVWGEVARLGRLRVLHPTGDEGGAGVVRRDDAFCVPRNSRSDPPEAGHPLGDRPHPRSEAHKDYGKPHNFVLLNPTIIGKLLRSTGPPTARIHRPRTLRSLPPHPPQARRLPAVSGLLKQLSHYQMRMLYFGSRICASGVDSDVPSS